MNVYYVLILSNLNKFYAFSSFTESYLHKFFNLYDKLTFIFIMNQPIY